MNQWPNLFIVGAPKAGTSSLYAHLKDIPEICMSDIKEPNYFSTSTIPNNSPLKPIRNKNEYLKLFSGCKDKKFIGEASSSYLADPDTPIKIHELSPDSRIIISLRDPVERAFSHYLMLVRYGRLNLSFHEEIQKLLNNPESNNFFKKTVIDRSLYFNNVQRYLNVFGAKQIKIIIFEDFVKSPEITINQILEFLGIPKSKLTLKNEVYNPYVVPRGEMGSSILKNRTIRRIVEKILSPSNRKLLKEKLIVQKKEKPSMEEIDRSTLSKLFNEDVHKIQHLLKIQLPWPNFSNM